MKIVFLLFCSLLYVLGGDTDAQRSTSDMCLAIPSYIYSLIPSTGVTDNTINGWFNYEADGYVANDGTVSYQQGKTLLDPGYFFFNTSKFTKTVPLDVNAGNDHVKNLQFYGQAQTVPSTGSLFCSAALSGQNLNVSPHPYGAAVRDPDSDYRLASSSIVTIDLQFGMTADFFITNTQIYALYERLTFARTPSYNYSAYTYMVPVATRQPADTHLTQIEYDGINKQINWWLDGKKVHTVARPGTLATSRNYLTLDRCGTEEFLFPSEIYCGLGTFTLLDGFPVCPATTTTPFGGQQCYHNSTDKALVQTEPYNYCNPLTGAATAPPYVFDNAHGTGHTLYGQGAVLKATSFFIHTLTPIINV